MKINTLTIRLSDKDLQRLEEMQKVLAQSLDMEQELSKTYVITYALHQLFGMYDIG